MKVNIADHEKTIQKYGAHNRLIKIFSSHIGNSSSGLDSLISRLATRAAELKEGIKVGEIKSFESAKQPCQIKYEGGLGKGSKN